MKAMSELFGDKLEGSSTRAPMDLIRMARTVDLACKVTRSSRGTVVIEFKDGSSVEFGGRRVEVAQGKPH